MHPKHNKNVRMLKILREIPSVSRGVFEARKSEGGGQAPSPSMRRHDAEVSI